MIAGRFGRLALAGLLALGLGFGLGGCLAFARPGAAPPDLFTLAPEYPSAALVETVTQAIEVATPRARPGFEGARMAYVTRAYEIQYFARHQWVEPPARLLAPLLGEALERGGFQVASSGEGMAPALRLETEIVALQQEFTTSPSQVRFALRTRLLAGPERRLVGSGAFEAVEPSPSEDPYGGVIAANRAVARVLEEVVKWSAAP